MNKDQAKKEIQKLRKKMKKASDNLDFEDAARIRDDIKRLELQELAIRDGAITGSEGEA